MKDAAALISFAQSYCEEHRDPRNVQKYARYFKEGFDAYGLAEGETKELKSMVQERFAPSIPDILSVGGTLFGLGKYELGTLAILLLADQSKNFDMKVFAGVQAWFDHGVGNWAHSDVLCSLVTPAFFSGGIAVLADLEPWRASESRWTRRAVPVTMLCLRKTAEPQNLLDLLAPMMTETERVAHQGLGWFLRELWKLHPAPVESFLLGYKNTAARLIFQYATEKMSPEAKLRFRKDKIAK